MGDGHRPSVQPLTPVATPLTVQEHLPMQWYIVNTFSNYENSVKRALEELSLIHI